MIHQERGRLSIAVGFSVVVHVVVAVFSGFFASPPALPDYLPPLRVELNVPEPLEPEPAPVPEPEAPAPEAPPEPPPVPQSELPAPAPQAPAPGSSSTGRDPMANRPPREFSVEEIMRGEETEAPRGQPRSGDLPPVDSDSLAPDVTLPDWAGTVLSDAGVSTDQMSVSEATDVADRIRRNPEFERLLSDAIAGVNRRASEPAPGAAPGETSGPGTGTEGPAAESADGSQGDPRLSWEGDNRGGAGPLPELTAADFGNQVPAETRFVVIFEVDEGGGVVPGSIILQQRSLYTQANAKIRSAIASWRFAPARGAGTQSAVFTLVVRREDVR